MSKNINDFFSQNEKDAITSAVEDAELSTSGEVRVHIENVCKGDVLDRAAQVFKQLEMHKTELRNGVLFYLAIENRKFAVIGDVGINQKVPSNYWEDVKNSMINKFRSDKFAEGLIDGITLAGEKLKEFFPYNKADVNELSDEISFKNN